MSAVNMANVPHVLKLPKLKMICINSYDNFLVYWEAFRNSIVINKTFYSYTVSQTHTVMLKLLNEPLAVSKGFAKKLLELNQNKSLGII